MKKEKSHRVIAARQLPIRLPVQIAVNIVIFTKLWDVSSVLLGVIWTLVAFLMVGAIIAKWQEEPTEIEFPKKPN